MQITQKNVEYLGYIQKKPSVNKDSGKWNYVDVCFSNTDDFNEASGKIINVLYKPDSDGQCMVSDSKGNKYLLELIFASFDTENNTIRVLPYTCTSTSNETKKAENKDKKNDGKK